MPDKLAMPDHPDLPRLTAHAVRNRAGWNAYSTEYQRDHGQQLRPGGLFAFSHGSTLLTMCWALDQDHPSDRLVFPSFGLHRIDDEQMAEFQLSYGDWIRLFRANDFTIEDLIEPQPAVDATSTYRDAEDLAWSRRWPAESIWRCRRT